jgi:hypothetical protein
MPSGAADVAYVVLLVRLGVGTGCDQVILIRITRVIHWMQRPGLWRERAVRIRELRGGRHITVILYDASAIDAWARFEHQHRHAGIQYLFRNQATHDAGSCDDDVCFCSAGHACLLNQQSNSDRPLFVRLVATLPVPCLGGQASGTRCTSRRIALAETILPH